MPFTSLLSILPFGKRRAVRSNNQSASNYIYAPLKGPKSFRLLRIHPPSPTSSNHIHCTIEEFDRGSPNTPPYTALSYVWGKVSHTVPIMVNSQQAEVTPNLFEALNHIARAFPDVSLWVDALSIKQSDPGEQAHQVAQMKDIYSGASQVICWLGPSYSSYDELTSMFSLQRRVPGPRTTGEPFSVAKRHFEEDCGVQWYDASCGAARGDGDVLWHIDGCMY